MQNRRERRKLLKQFGLLDSNKGSKINAANIESGKEIHRVNLQEMKNREIEKSSSNQVNDDPFFYRNQKIEYTSFQSLLISKNWDELERD